jgi:hypothetical protein
VLQLGDRGEGRQGRVGRSLAMLMALRWPPEKVSGRMT